MNRLILRALNSPILVLLTAIAIAIQTSLFAAWPLRFFQPDIVLLIVIWCGLKRDFLEGGVITLIIAEIAELHSSVPQGVFLIGYMALYLILRAADKLFVLPTQLPMLKVTLASAAGWRICEMVVLSMVAPHRYLWRQMIVHVIPGAVMAAVFGVWVFRALEKFDTATFKNASAENPDEFQIENLGL
jgi:hypothetical protein